MSKAKLESVLFCNISFLASKDLKVYFLKTLCSNQQRSGNQLRMRCSGGRGGGPAHVSMMRGVGTPQLTVAVEWLIPTFSSLNTRMEPSPLQFCRLVGSAGHPLLESPAPLQPDGSRAGVTWGSVSHLPASRAGVASTVVGWLGVSLAAAPSG